MVAHYTKATPYRVPFWFKPVITFGLLVLTAFTRSSHVLVVPAHPSRLNAIVLGRFHLPSRGGVPVTRWLLCPRSFIPGCYQLRMSG